MDSGQYKRISDQLTTGMGEIEQRRAHVRERYAQLRVDHPALPPVLRDFQVQGANNSIIDCWKGSYWMLFLSLLRLTSYGRLQTRVTSSTCWEQFQLAMANRCLCLFWPSFCLLVSLLLNNLPFLQGVSFYAPPLPLKFLSFCSLHVFL